jgi:hypothetical protein
MYSTPAALGSVAGAGTAAFVGGVKAVDIPPLAVESEKIVTAEALRAKHSGGKTGEEDSRTGSIDFFGPATKMRKIFRPTSHIDSFTSNELMDIVLHHDNDDSW